MEKKEILKEIEESLNKDGIEDLINLKKHNTNCLCEEKNLINLDFKTEENKFSQKENSTDSYTIITSEPIMKFTNFSKTDILHFNYGEVSFRVEETDENYIKCLSLNSGMIQRYNSISVEGKEHFSNDLVNVDENKLMKELNSAKDLDVDFVVMSVIDNPIVEIKYI
jgi:pyruvate kinase